MEVIIWFLFLKTLKPTKTNGSKSSSPRKTFNPPKLRTELFPSRFYDKHVFPPNIGPRHNGFGMRYPDIHFNATRRLKISPLVPSQLSLTEASGRNSQRRRLSTVPERGQNQGKPSQRRRTAGTRRESTRRTNGSRSQPQNRINECRTIRTTIQANEDEQPRIVHHDVKLFVHYDVKLADFV